MCVCLFTYVNIYNHTQNVDNVDNVADVMVTFFTLVFASLFFRKARVLYRIVT